MVHTTGKVSCVFNYASFLTKVLLDRIRNMVGRLIEGKSHGDEALPMFPASEESKKISVGHDETKEKHAPKKTRHGLPLLTSVLGFLLGMLASHVMSKRSASRQLSSVSSSSSFQATETTSLRHSSGVIT